MERNIFTIGHSNLALADFINLLKSHGITAIADVRSTPYSKYHAHFNIDRLKNSLRENNIAYAFLGKELGARSEDMNCYIDNKVQYDLLAKQACFHEGISRVLKGTNLFRIALLCAEKDPLTCHRAILICRYLAKQVDNILHIRTDCSLESHEQLEHRLVKHLDLCQSQLFTEKALSITDVAYELQSQKIAYTLVKHGLDNEPPSKKLGSSESHHARKAREHDTGLHDWLYQKKRGGVLY